MFKIGVKISTNVLIVRERFSVVMMMVSPESHLAPLETSPDVHSPGHRTPLTDAGLRWCVSVKMLRCWLII